MKNYFPTIEFLEASSIGTKHELTSKEVQSIRFWQHVLNPLRGALDFPIKITDWLRIHNGEQSRSQHYVNEDWSVKGALDIRPFLKGSKRFNIMLGLVLAAHPKIKRVCYYTQSERFAWGGFHIDCKGEEKRLFINEGAEINWRLVDEVKFIDAIAKSL